MLKPRARTQNSGYTICRTSLRTPGVGMKDKKCIICATAALCLTVLPCSARAQVKESVYSIFGIGELLDNNLGLSRSLGGTGIAFQSGRAANYVNPASYLGLPRRSITIELGVCGIQNTAEDRNARQNHHDISFSYGALNCRAADWWAFSLGVFPYSHIAYEIRSTDAIGGERSRSEKTFKGSGGVSRLGYGNSFNVLEGLAVGFDLSYIAGSITETEGASGTNSLASYELKYDRTVRTFYVDYGVQYSVTNRGWSYTLGAIYGAPKELDLTDNLTLTSNGMAGSLDRADHSVIKIPQKFGLGASAQTTGLRFGGDYEVDYWSAVRFSNSHFRAKDSRRYSCGVEYSPGATDGGPEVMSYRLGGNFRSSYLEIDNTSINSFGIIVGAGIFATVVHLNVSLEYGEEGTLRNGLVKNSYWMLYLSVSLRQEWAKFSPE